MKIFSTVDLAARVMLAVCVFNKLDFTRLCIFIRKSAVTCDIRSEEIVIENVNFAA